MQTVYRPLLSFEIRHAYVRFSPCRALVASPSAWADTSLHRLHPVHGGGTLFIDSRPIVSSALRADGEPWRFAATTTDPELPAYTHLQRGVGDIVLFQGAGVPGSTEARDLAPVVVACRPRRFAFTPPARDGTRGPGSIALLSGDQVVARIAPNEAGDYTIDLGDRPDGRYRLRRGKIVLLDFYATRDSCAGLWGLVELSVDPSEASPARFTANLPARAVEWRYHVMDKNGPARGLDTCHVALRETSRARPARATFTNCGLRDGPCGPAFVFRSTTPLALSARPDADFQLTLRSGPEERRPWSMPLPYAKPRDLVRDPGDGSLNAEIYVTL